MLTRANYAAKRLTATFAFISCGIAFEILAADSPPRTSLLSTELQQIAQNASAAPTSAPAANSTARFDSSGRVQVDVHYECAVSAPTKELAAAGLQISASVKVAPMCVVEGWVLPQALGALAEVQHVVQIRIPSYSVSQPVSPPVSTQRQAQILAQRSAGSPAIDGTAVSIMHADSFVSQTGVTGSGVTVGVISGNVTNLSTIQSRGELPAVTVLPSSPGGSLNSLSNDEGTMMLEEIHAVAPGASLEFCSGLPTDVTYVGCAQQLIANGANVIVDDVQQAEDDLMSAGGPVATAIQSLLSTNGAVMLISITDNFNGSYWEGNYNPVPVTSIGAGALSCSGQVDNYATTFITTAINVLTVKQAGQYPVILQWADPFDQNVSDFDLYVLDLSNGVFQCFPTVGLSTTYLYSPAVSIPQGVFQIVIATPDQTLSGKFIKLFVGGNNLTELSSPTTGSIVSPQAFAQGVLTTGAVIGSDGIGNIIEPYSGQGPITLAFPTATSIPAPSFVAPDAVYVDAASTTFQSELGSDGLFHGTSAAAPNAAAVAALIRSAFPSLTPAQVTAALQTGATQLGASIPDSTYGYGRVDAIGALNTIPAPTLTGFASAAVTGPSSTPANAITLAGTGKLAVSAKSSNAALIPIAGVAVSPAGCGTTTLSCNVIVTPAPGKSGSATVTLLVTDGANRSASIPATITVNKPAAPTVSIAAGQSQTINEGSSPSAIGFTITGTGALTVTASSTNTTLLPNSGIAISSGCVSSTQTCTASLSVASGQSGNATITISVTDSYGQTATSGASLSVKQQAAASHSGGGGGMDLDTLVALAIALGWRMCLWTRLDRRRGPRTV